MGSARLPRLLIPRTPSKATPKRSGPAWALPRPLRRLPRHGRPRRPRPRHHPGLGIGPHRRGPVQDDPPRRARHRDAGVHRAAHLRSRVWQILAYLRTLAAPAPTDPPRGNAENGAKLFRAKCASCHRVNGAGGRLGPDLSRIGSARSARRAAGAHSPRLRGLSRRLRAGDASRRPTASRSRA